MPKSVLRNLRPEQLAALTSEQLAALSPDQLSAMAPEQLAALNAEAVSNLPPELRDQVVLLQASPSPPQCMILMSLRCAAVLLGSPACALV